MKFRGLDADSDWMIGQGFGSYAQEEAALALDIATRIRSWYGNCFFDPQNGVDWINRLEKNQVENLKLEIQAVILQTQGVIKINSMDLSFPFAGDLWSPGSARESILVYNIQTIYSPSFQKQVAMISGAPNA